MRTWSNIAWLPVLALTVGVVLVTPTDWPRWAFMWLLAAAIFFGLKCLTWASAPRKGTVTQQLGYFLLWPGLDAPRFLTKPATRLPSIVEWCFATSKLVFGIALFATVPWIPTDRELLRGWVGMIGILFVLHFGLFHLMSLAWRSSGVEAQPIMNWPIRATSVAEFWGRRWNAAFRDVTHRFVFRPLVPRVGAGTALVAVFVISGLVHDLVISLPAGAGYSLPTSYFLIQSGAVFLERTALGARVGLGRGVAGWLFTMLTVVAPLEMLFHPPFVRQVILPFLDWIVAIF